MNFHDRDITFRDYEPSSATKSFAYGILTLYIICQLLIYFDIAVLPPQELLWNALVYILPAQLLLDRAKREELLRNGNMISQSHAAKSDALRKIFGAAGEAAFQKLPAEGLLKPSTGFSWQQQQQQRQSTSNRPPGLGNWDNSCYQNSVLQGLAALDTLKPFLQRLLAAEDESESTGETLLETLRQLNSVANNGKRLWTPAKLKSMSSWQQQDAQEYFSKIMDELDKEAAKTFRFVKEERGLESVVEEQNEQSQVKQGQVEKEALRFRNPMEGLLAQRVACTNCGFSEGLSMIPFNCLTVPLGSLASYSMEACLDEYTNLEEISEVECTKCTLLKWRRSLENMLGTESTTTSDNTGGMDKQMMALPPELRLQTFHRLTAIQKALENDDFADKTLNEDCQIPKKGRVSSTKTRQAVIGRVPQNLMVHVNRSVFDELTGAQRKNYAEVRYPLTLDLGSWMLSQTANEKASAESSVITNASRSMLSGAAGDKPSCIYRLKAVVTHYGRHENGHYICYRNYPSQWQHDADPREPDEDLDLDTQQDTKPQWWCLSDDDVSMVSQEDVLAQGGVFMLFYERETDLRTPEYHSFGEANDASIGEDSSVGGRGILTPPEEEISTSGVLEDLKATSEVAQSPNEMPKTPAGEPEAEVEYHTAERTESERLLETSSRSSGVEEAPPSKSSSSTTSSTPVMRTAGARKASRSSLGKKSKGFGASNFRPVAAT